MMNFLIRNILDCKQMLRDILDCMEMLVHPCKSKKCFCHQFLRAKLEGTLERIMEKVDHLLAVDPGYSKIRDLVGWLLEKSRFSPARREAQAVMKDLGDRTASLLDTPGTYIPYDKVLNLHEAAETCWTGVPAAFIVSQ